ncbi:MAG: hypothetical protein VX399_07980, partial [SAR324 cluster bacterium]|nr:hypothetical protein [SAR324 cluster bacterium]
MKWWLQQMISSVCHGCWKILRVKTFDDPAYPFLCTECLKQLLWFDPEGRCSLCGMEQETGMQKACSHGVSIQWHLDQLCCGIVYGGMLQDWILAIK